MKAQVPPSPRPASPGRPAAVDRLRPQSSLMPEREVRVVSASSGTAAGFRVALPRAQAVLDRFRVADLYLLTMVGWDHRGETVPAGRRC